MKQRLSYSCCNTELNTTKESLIGRPIIHKELYAHNGKARGWTYIGRVCCHYTTTPLYQTGAHLSVSLRIPSLTSLGVNCTKKEKVKRWKRVQEGSRRLKIKIKGFSKSWKCWVLIKETVGKIVFLSDWRVCSLILRASESWRRPCFCFVLNCLLDNFKCFMPIFMFFKPF